MIRDAMDVLNPHAENTAKATYYHTRNDPTTVGGMAISFEFVDPRSSAYRRTFGNLQDFNVTTTTIRTKDRFKYMIGGVIVTGDGACYRILECSIDPGSAPKQAFRMFRIPLGVDFLLRLQSIDDPWGLV